MAFQRDSKETARKTMLAINVDLADKYAQLIEFLAMEPGTASALRGRNSPEVGSAEYIQLQAIAFSESRKPRAPQPPSTVPDEMVSVILNEYFDVPTEELGRRRKNTCSQWVLKILLVSY